jgi:Rps23 Pro-64 3,4-dihydroxylase Tpa1-like proline 4-hydroxylase
MEKIVNDQNWFGLSESFLQAKPFNHVVIDNFFVDSFARTIFNDMPGYEENNDAKYDNPIEKKRTIQNWTKFPKNIYKAATFLVNQEFTGYLRQLTWQNELMADFGLHGGGIHMHQTGDYLNAHLDYDIHPKLDMKRKLNLIVYLNPNWQESWGGNLGLWSHDEETGQAKDLIKSVPPLFNRAILFDTSQNSWHGVTEGIFAPEGEYRKSLAFYYLIPTKDISNRRQKALFVPRTEQKGDQSVVDFIKVRSGY